MFVFFAFIQEKGSKHRRSGLLSDHPYCVTGLARVRTTQSAIDSSQNGLNGPHDTNLVRLRSPWAGSEYGGIWCGAWSERNYNIFPSSKFTKKAKVFNAI